MTAIARPSSRPRGHGVRLGTQSAITSVINTTLIWPNAKLDRIGSRYTTAGATSAAASQARCCQVAATCSRVSTMVTDAISSTSNTAEAMASGLPVVTRLKNTTSIPKPRCARRAMA